MNNKRKDMTDQPKELSAFLPDDYHWENLSGNWWAHDGRIALGFGSTKRSWMDLGLLHPSEGGGFQRMKYFTEMAVTQRDIIYRDGFIDYHNSGYSSGNPTPAGWRPHYEQESQCALPQGSGTSGQDGSEYRGMFGEDEPDERLQESQLIADQKFDSNVLKTTNISQVSSDDEAEFEELLGRYWDLAYDEGDFGTPEDDEASKVLHKLRELFRANSTVCNRQMQPLGVAEGNSQDVRVSESEPLKSQSQDSDIQGPCSECDRLASELNHLQQEHDYAMRKNRENAEVNKLIQSCDAIRLEFKYWKREYDDVMRQLSGLLEGQEDSL